MDALSRSLFRTAPNLPLNPAMPGWLTDSRPSFHHTDRQRPRPPPPFRPRTRRTSRSCRPFFATLFLRPSLFPAAFSFYRLLPPRARLCRVMVPCFGSLPSPQPGMDSSDRPLPRRSEGRDFPSGAHVSLSTDRESQTCSLPSPQQRAWYESAGSLRRSGHPRCPTFFPRPSHAFPGRRYTAYEKSRLQKQAAPGTSASDTHRRAGIDVTTRNQACIPG